jgi:hypothetical protein
MIECTLFHSYPTAVITVDGLEDLSAFVFEVFVIFLHIKVLFFSLVYSINLSTYNSTESLL